MVDEHVPAADDREQAALPLSASASRVCVTGAYGSSLQLRPVEAVQSPQPGEVGQRPVERDVVLGRGRARTRQQLEPRSGTPGLDLQAHGAAEAAAPRLHLEGDEEVVGLLLLDTVRSALRVTRNIRWSTTVMPGNKRVEVGPRSGLPGG